MQNSRLYVKDAIQFLQFTEIGAEDYAGTEKVAIEKATQSQHNAIVVLKIWRYSKMSWIYALNENVNLCDGCLHHFATCKSHPKFNPNPKKDNVIACDAYNGRLTQNGKYGVIDKKMRGK